MHLDLEKAKINVDIAASLISKKPMKAITEFLNSNMCEADF